MFWLIGSGGWIASGGGASSRDVRSVPLAEIWWELSLLSASWPITIGRRMGRAFLRFAVRVRTTISGPSS